MTRGDWRTHALAAISGGCCPNHGLTLTTPGRFCFACECTYRIDGATVVATYAPARWP